MNIVEEPAVLIVERLSGAAIPIVWDLGRVCLTSDFVGSVGEAVGRLKADDSIRVVVIDEELVSCASITALREVFAGPVVVIDDHCGGTPKIPGTVTCRPEAVVETVQEQLHVHSHC